MVRIKDVAKLANVSPSSVSRYLNNPDVLSSEKRISIEKAIKELNYVPSPVATSMRIGKTKTIALIIPSLTNIYYTDLYVALRESILAQGYMVNLYTTENDPQILINYLQEIPKRKYDGAIICYLDEPRLTPELKKAQEQFPIVLITCDPNKSDFNCVFIDSKDAMFKATNHLIEMGRKNIAFVAGNQESIITQEKYLGYLSAMKKASLEVKKEYIFYGERNHFATGFMAVREFTSLPIMPDGIVCIIDDISIGCIKSLLINGYKVPEDVAVIGFNGIKILDTYEPSISTIQQPIQETADKAVEFLMKDIDRPRSHKKQCVFMGELIVRHSTDATAKSGINLSL